MDMENGCKISMSRTAQGMKAITIMVLSKAKEFLSGKVAIVLLKSINH